MNDSELEAVAHLLELSLEEFAHSWDNVHDFIVAPTGMRGSGSRCVIVLGREVTTSTAMGVALVLKSILPKEWDVQIERRA